VNTYPDYEDQLAPLAQQGGTFGIHFAISATSPSFVRMKMSNSFGQAATLRLADRSDYGVVLSLPEGYEPPTLAGRGLVKGRPTLEFQAALPADGATEAERTAGVRTTVARMAQVWSGPRPWVVRTLPEHVQFADLLALAPKGDGDAGLAAPVGLEVDELEPLFVDLRDGPHFLVTGPPRGGKTGLLTAWLLGLADRVPASNLLLYLADFGRGSLSALERLPHTRQRIDTDADLATALDDIEGCLAARDGSAAAHVLVVDDLSAFQQAVGSEQQNRLTDLVRGRRRPGFHVLLAGTSAAFGASYDGLGHAVKEMQTGFLVGGSEYDDLQVLGINVPHAEAREGLPPGRGFFGHRKRFVRIKVAEVVLEVRS
jgi:S-DNA-T family DNA segregation ATPase FtsK/SpoIIIE